jgi:hypothetical protein
MIVFYIAQYIYIHFLNRVYIQSLYTVISIIFNRVYIIFIIQYVKYCENVPVS